MRSHFVVGVAWRQGASGWHKASYINKSTGYRIQVWVISIDPQSLTQSSHCPASRWRLSHCTTRGSDFKCALCTLSTHCSSIKRSRYAWPTGPLVCMTCTFLPRPVTLTPSPTGWHPESQACCILTGKGAFHSRPALHKWAAPDRPPMSYTGPPCWAATISMC